MHVGLFTQFGFGLSGEQLFCDCVGQSWEIDVYSSRQPVLEHFEEKVQFQSFPCVGENNLLS